MTAANNILTFLVFVPIITITRHNEQTSPIRSNPHAPSLQRYSHRGRQFIVDCCVLSQHGSHLRPRPHPSLLDEPSYSPAAAAAAASSPGCCDCCCFLARLLLLPRPTVVATAAAATSPHCCCCCLLARLLLLLLQLLPRPTVAATAAAAAASSPDCCGCCCCSQYRAHNIAFGELVTKRSFSST